MASYGYSFMCELYGPNELLAQAARADEAGFDFVTISDHFHPWLYSHKHSPYAWSVLGALAAQTMRLWPSAVLHRSRSRRGSEMAWSLRSRAAS
jgi:alkanesulfonate monooxygenase SsuD/methylene tetrahydromethanopterin reductase-like flavin-dependent oxidoreductase (luciferase family)